MLLYSTNMKENMKSKTTSLIATTLLAFNINTYTHAKTKAIAMTTQINKVNHNLIIFYNPDITNTTELIQAVNQYDATLLYRYNMLHAIAIAIPKNQTLEDAEHYFYQIKGVQLINRDYIQQLN